MRALAAMRVTTGDSMVQRTQGDCEKTILSCTERNEETSFGHFYLGGPFVLVATSLPSI